MTKYYLSIVQVYELTALEICAIICALIWESNI